MNSLKNSFPLLRCNNISVAFGFHTVLDKISITITGREIHAIDLGIETLHQQINLMKNMNSYENIFLNRELRSLLFFNNKKNRSSPSGESHLFFDIQ